MKNLPNTMPSGPAADLTPEVQQAKMRFGIVGNAPALIAAVRRAIRVAPIDLSVLVTGESGTGKEFFPKIIHAYSPRKHARYIAVNCGAIPEGTIDSELFGHEKGSFTGAIASRKGYFEEADGGTIFLDEVAELPMTTQARLLRVLETGEFMKVGSSNVQKTNIRIVAATNVDLRRAIAEGRFREDLYYRLSTVQITIPPLRDRGSDIRLLARKFASDFSETYRTPPVTFSPEAFALMERYRWPGNVRQLKNVVDQLALFDAGGEISPEALESYLPTTATLPTVQGSVPERQGSSVHYYDRERDMLFNMIFNLRGRLDQISSRLDALASRIEHDEHTPLAQRRLPVTVDLIDNPVDSDFSPAEEAFPDEQTPVESPVAETPSASMPTLSISDNERELIRKALERNNGVRKDAARELNISERTLYRKIKEYHLD